MPNSYYNIRAPEMMWDIPRIVSGEQNLQCGLAGSFALAPTAVNGGVWQLVPNGNTVAHIWHISFSTDTAIGWRLYAVGVSAGLTSRGVKSLGLNAASTTATFAADVAAAPANTGFILQGRAAANSYTDLLQKSWIEAQGTTFIITLVTDAVAANCIANFHWTELLQ